MSKWQPIATVPRVADKSNSKSASLVFSHQGVLVTSDGHSPFLMRPQVKAEVILTDEEHGYVFIGRIEPLSS